MFIKKRRNHTKSLAKVQSKTLTHTCRQERPQLHGGKENRLARLGSGISQCQLDQCQQQRGGDRGVAGAGVRLQAKGKVSIEGARGGEGVAAGGVELRYSALVKLLNTLQAHLLLFSK